MSAGSRTNTPALAGVLQYLQGYAGDAARDQLLGEPVVAYSVTYPLGVVGMLVAITLATAGGASTTPPRRGARAIGRAAPAGCRRARSG